MTPTTNHAEIPTPRVDAALNRPQQNPYGAADIARQLERELAQANAQLEATRESNRVMRDALLWADDRTKPDRSVSEEVWGNVPPTPVESALASSSPSAMAAKLAELEEDRNRLSWGVNHPEEFADAMMAVDRKWTPDAARNEQLWRAYLDAARSQSAQPDASP